MFQKYGRKSKSSIYCHSQQWKFQDHHCKELWQKTIIYIQTRFNWSKTWSTLQLMTNFIKITYSQSNHISTWKATLISTAIAFGDLSILERLCRNLFILFTLPFRVDFWSKVYFFEYENVEMVTVKGEHYRRVFANFLYPLLEHLNINTISF